ncbi:MAG: acyltransferase [Cyanobacteria bacterium P01_A01_bin.105]
MVKTREVQTGKNRASVLPSRRILYLDYAKGIGIFLVVLGHSFGSLFTPDAQPSKLLWQVFYYVVEWIYTFHMPLFFFISGLFLEKLAKKPLKGFLINRLIGIVYPYLVWSVLQEKLRTITGIRHEPLTHLWQILYSPLMQFWFLYVLFLISIVAVLLRKLQVSVEVIFGLSSLLLASLLIDLNLGPWGVLYMVRVYSLYFAAGAVCGKWRVLPRLARLGVRGLAQGTFLGFGVVTLAVLFKVASVPVLAALWATAGIFSTLLLAMYLDRTHHLPFVRFWGQRSLEIYLAHTIFSAAAATLVHRLLGPSYLALEVMVSLVAGMAGPVVLYRFCQRWRLMFLFRLQLVKE